MTDVVGWTDTAETWYASLESGGLIYGVARRVPTLDPDTREIVAVSYEVFVPETDSWTWTSEGAGLFTGAGGVTDADPIPEVRALGLVIELRDAFLAALAAEDDQG